jgi:hypothetical protein
MFGPRITTVFASRWRALWWCAGILSLAYCSVPGADKLREENLAKANAAQAPHKSPWDKR